MNHEPQKNQSPRTSPPMSAADFAEWGAEQMAYIKPIKINGGTFYGVFAANGQQLGLMDTPDVARAAVIQNDLEPVSVH